MLQRMTIATIQAFKQRAFKGLPKTDPDTGEEIDYDSIFTADPGAGLEHPPDCRDLGIRRGRPDQPDRPPTAMT